MSTFKLFLLSVLICLICKLGVAQAQQPALRFIPLAPCRIADTRNATGPFGGPSIAGHSSRGFVISNSTCGVPSTAAAYSLNVTAVPKTSVLHYVTIWPTGAQQPVVSTLNSDDGRIRANAAIVPAGFGGAISVYATDPTDVILDINGYFVPATNPSGLAFFPLAPCRVVDTRNPTGPLGGPSLVGQQARSFPVLSSSCNIPLTAQAYSLNFTAVPKGFLGFLSTWPAGMPQVLVSTLNAWTGAITANAAIVPAGSPNGAINVFVQNDADVVIDINGYFAPSTSGNDLSFYALTPCRVLDTRLTTSAFLETLPVDTTASPCGVIPSAQAIVLNATVAPAQPLHYLTLWPYAQPQPLVSTLNANDGLITANMAIVPTASGMIDAYATDRTQLVLDTSGYFAGESRASLLWGQMILPFVGLRYPDGVAVDVDGNIFVSDLRGGSPDDPTTFNIPAIVKMDPQGSQNAVSTSGVDTPSAVAVDTSGSVYVAVAEGQHDRVVKVTRDAIQSVVASVGDAYGVAVDGQDNVYVSSGNDTIFKIVPNGTLTTFATGQLFYDAIATDAAGNIYVFDGQAIIKFNPQGQITMVADAPDCYYYSLAVDALGNIYCGTEAGVQRRSTTGAVSTIVSGLNTPRIAVDGSGNVYIADSGNIRILKLQPGPSVEIGIIPVGQSVQGTMTYQIAVGTTVGVTVAGSSIPGEFTLPAGSSCVPLNGKCTFAVSFTPSATGVRNGTVTLHDQGQQTLITTWIYGVGK